MATESVSESVPVLFMEHPNDPDGFLEYVSPLEAEFLRLTKDFDADQWADVHRVGAAIKAGAFNYTAAEIAAWTPAQRRAVIDSLSGVEGLSDALGKGA